MSELTGQVFPFSTFLWPLKACRKSSCAGGVEGKETGGGTPFFLCPSCGPGCSRLTTLPGSPTCYYLPLPRPLGLPSPGPSKSGPVGLWATTTRGPHNLSSSRTGHLGGPLRRYPTFLSRLTPFLGECLSLGSRQRDTVESHSEGTLERENTEVRIQLDSF